ncbi:MAG: hypothetical protein NT133_04940 [Alphaproteobacteria bacterium]|nr:hypothetical protein [Alphaproteobacteria bacterium]
MNIQPSPPDLKSAAAGVAAEVAVLVRGLMTMLGLGFLRLFVWSRDARALFDYMQDVLRQFGALMERIAAGELPPPVAAPQAGAVPPAPRTPRAAGVRHDVPRFRRVIAEQSVPEIASVRARRASAPLTWFITAPRASAPPRLRAMVALRRRRCSKTDFACASNCALFVPLSYLIHQTRR